MYLSLRDRPAGPPPLVRSRRAGVARTVVLLGAVSLLTDVSSESVNAILPVYLTTVVGLSALGYGVVDGVYQGVSALVRIAGGYLSDRTDHPKWIALAGYAGSAVSRVLLIPATTFASITGVITLDRLAKGLRTAPRDSLIAASSAPESLGRSFGVHRALDTVGALIGPLLAFWVLWLVPGDYRAVFVVSVAFAVVGVAVLMLLVPDRRPRRTPHADGATPAAPRPVVFSWSAIRRARLGPLLIAAAVLGVLTVGDGFLYLELSYRDALAATYFPLLYIGTNVAYLALAVPLGRCSDRFGRARVYIGGHVALLACYVVTALPFDGATLTITSLLLLGVYYAATDGVLPAIAGRRVAAGVRATGIATAQTVVAVARFVSSLGFALLWTGYGRVAALVITAGLLAAALPGCAVLMRRGSSPAPAAEPV